MTLHLARLLALVALLALPLTGGGPQAVAADSSSARAAARVIVKYKALGQLMRGAGARGPRHAAAMAARTRLALADGRIIDGRTQVLLGGTDLTSAQLAARLAADDEVEYAVPDLRRRAMAVPADPLFAGSAATSPVVGQWYLRAPDSTLVSAINAAGAWDISTGSASIVVADLDSGVRFDHPDLVNKLYPGYDFVTDLDTAGDGDGRDANAADPGDWTAANECAFGEPASGSSWHGTQTAGLIGAQTGNGTGMASVGYNVMLLPVRVLGKCGGFDSDILAAMLWAGGVSANPVVNAHPARVINLSLGSAGNCTAAYQDVIGQLTAAGVVVVASAGNEEGLAVSTPGNCSGVIAVAGLRHAGTKVGFSSIGPEVTVSAPAGNCVNLTGACLYPILTTINSGTTTPVPSDNAYSDSSNISVGTSFSSPLVAGTVALMLSVNPSLTPAQVKTMLKSSARAFPTTSTDPAVLQCKAPTSVAQDECLCTTSTCGAGMLDAAAAVAAAAGNSLPSVSLSASATSVLAGSSVSFSSSGSTVASGRTIASYQWTITSGGAIAAISGSSSGASLQVNTSGGGSFTVQLTVTDSAGAKASRSATVTVNAAAAPTVKLLASAQVVAAGGSVTVDGSGSSAAAGLAVAAYQWTLTSGAGLATITSPPSGASVTVATSGSGSGSFTLRLTVTDSLGQQSSDSITINVTAVTPVASISASALTVTAGGSVNFDGSASTAPSGRSIASYQWALTGGGNLATISGSSSGATASVATSAAGSFTLRLTVTDSAGAQDSRSTTVTVNAAGGGGGGGGGGAMQGGWLAGLALAVAGLFGLRRR